MGLEVGGGSFFQVGLSWGPIGCVPQAERAMGVSTLGRDRRWEETGVWQGTGMWQALTGMASGPLTPAAVADALVAL